MILNRKSIIILVTTVFLLSTFFAASVMAQCPTCDGTGKVTCPYCQGTGKITMSDRDTCTTCLGTGKVDPTVEVGSYASWLSDGKVYVQAKFQNTEEKGVYGKATAEVDAPTKTYTGTSARTYLPAGQEVDITVTISDVSPSDYEKLKQQMKFPTRVYPSSLDKIVCPRCDGQTAVLRTIECPDCSGTRFLSCPDCGGTGIEGGQNVNSAFNLDIGGTAFGVIAIAGVSMGAYVLLKRRKMSEQSLRRMPSFEFQNWVLKKLGGKVASEADARMGIDGLSAQEKPVLIRQADGVGKSEIERLAASLGRAKAREGLIVAFSFADDAYLGKVRAKLNYRLEITMVTVKELIEGRERTY